MREKIINILLEINPDIELNENINWVKSGSIDSFDISNIVISLEEEFNIEISASEIIPDNFANVDCLLKMVERTINKGGKNE